MIEEVKKDNLTAVLCFIDFKKAFESIHRSTMVKILEAYGVPPNLLRAIETMYAGTRARVVTPDGNSEEFNILAGVMQGDTLAPFLFIMVLDYALRKAISGQEQDLGFTLTPRRSRRPHSSPDRPGLCGRHQPALRQRGASTGTPEQSGVRVCQEGTVLKEVKDFKYLGSWVNSTEQDLKVYERGTNVEQFVTRFLLKESANQIQSLLSSVESAVDAIDEQHSQSGHQPAKVSPRMSERRNENTVPDYPPNNRVTAREAVRTVNTASGAVEVRKEGLDSQINRLAELIGRLENK
ncbi:hypothetical protein JOQ06_002475, partial [Pogonophryne albipinna]